jgi:hypothetical protein
MPALQMNTPVSSMSLGEERPATEWFGCANLNAWRQLTTPEILFVTNSPRQSLVHAVRQFEAFHDGWLGQGTKGISVETIERVLSAAETMKHVDDLPNPELTPNTNGTVSMEWESKRGEVYIEFGKTRVSGFIRISNETPQYFKDMNSLPETIFDEIRSQLFPSSGSVSITFQGAGMNGYTFA